MAIDTEARSLPDGRARDHIGLKNFPPSFAVESHQWRRGDNGFLAHQRSVAEETPVAFTYNGGTYAVMMATPSDLEDFAIGFSFTERLVKSPAEISDLDVCRVGGGLELRMWLADQRAEQLATRRRQMVGPTGCGLCGIESIAQALRRIPPIRSQAVFQPEDVSAAMHALRPLQHLHDETRATHAAAFWSREEGIVHLREDVGRHNALDKLIGALMRSNVDARSGIIALTSRLSVEMVQKVGAIGAPVVASVSAPTGLALRLAEMAQITVAAIVRNDGFEVFTHPQRLRSDHVKVVRRHRSVQDISRSN